MRSDAFSSHSMVHDRACTERRHHRAPACSPTAISRTLHAEIWWIQNFWTHKSETKKFLNKRLKANSWIKLEILFTFWRPGNLNLARLNASMQWALCVSLARTDMIGWPMLTRATVPNGLPNAPLIPVCRRSAPAHDNILLMRMTWNGWTRMRMWNASLPQNLTRYLLAQIRAASSASDDSCSYSSDTRWTHSGNSSTRALLRPKSKMRILASNQNHGLQFFFISINSINRF